ncbi:thiamine phosphate synthase [Bacillus mangrovi]|uniref:Thiamine-phosphate synthase n=1 Tax=Metabacillus mangrovi TaxID=1491830 RepID=A0A7X2V5M4_9BACI|nr:thiamine phosphate synthase [Metabacillus mangrovi]MTH54331.1 thiamine phosphate synthase [Metabacillus mangrovi]
MRAEFQKENLSLYFIAGTQDCPAGIETVLRQAIEGGITMFQFREKGPGSLDSKDDIVSLAIRLQAICREAAIPFIINDDVDLAVKIGADGVHVGQEDEKALEIRAKLKGKILGVSVHSSEEAAKAKADGADYIGVGPVYPTTSKADAKEARGTEVIRDIRLAGMQIPLVGIGGITAENAAPVFASGADGVSVISSISRAQDPKEAARRFSAIIG